MKGRAGDTATVCRLWVAVLLFAAAKVCTTESTDPTANPAMWLQDYKDQEAQTYLGFLEHKIGTRGVPKLIVFPLEDAALRMWYARANATASIDNLRREEYELITADAFVDRALREYEPLPPIITIYEGELPGMTGQYSGRVGEFHRESIDSFTTHQKTHVAPGERQRAMQWAVDHQNVPYLLPSVGRRVVVRKTIIDLQCPRGSPWIFVNNACYAGDVNPAVQGCFIDDAVGFMPSEQPCAYMKQAALPCSFPAQSRNSSSHCVTYKKTPRQVECPPDAEPVIRDGKIKSCRSPVKPRQFVYSRVQSNGKPVELLAPFTYSLKFRPPKVCPVVPHPQDPDPTRCRVAEVTPADVRCRDASAPNLILGNRTCLGIAPALSTESVKLECPAKSYWVPKLRRCMRMERGAWRCPKQYTLNSTTGLCDPPTQPKFECPMGLEFANGDSCITRGFQDGCKASVANLEGLLSATLVGGACEVVREKQYRCPEGFELGSMDAGPDECLQVKKAPPSYVCPEGFSLKRLETATHKNAPPPLCVGKVLRPGKLECPQRQEVNPFAAAKADNLGQPLDPEFYSDEADLDPDWSTENEEILESDGSADTGSRLRVKRTENHVNQRRNDRFKRRNRRRRASVSDTKKQEEKQQGPFPFCYRSIYTKPGYICPLDSMFMHNGLTPFCVYPASQTFAKQSCPNNASYCAARADPSLEAGGLEETIVAQPYCPKSGKLVQYGLCETRIPVVPKRVCPPDEKPILRGLWCEGTGERPALRQCPSGFTFYPDTNECKRFETQPAKQFCRVGETTEKRGDQQVCVSRTQKLEYHAPIDITFQAAIWCPWNTTLDGKATKKCIGGLPVAPVPECRRGGFPMPNEFNNDGLNWLAPFRDTARNVSKTTNLPVCIVLDFEPGYKGFSNEVSKSAHFECQDLTMTLVGDTCQRYADRERVFECPINARWNAEKTLCELGKPTLFNPRLYEYTMPQYTAPCKSEDYAGFCWDMEASPAPNRCPSGYQLDNEVCKKPDQLGLMCPPDMVLHEFQCVRYLMMDPIQRFHNGCGYNMHYNCSSCPMGYKYTCDTTDAAQVPLFKPFNGVDHFTGIRPELFMSSNVVR